MAPGMKKLRFVLAAVVVVIALFYLALLLTR